jgi:chromosome segregation ATPase
MSPTTEKNNLSERYEVLQRNYVELAEAFKKLATEFKEVKVLYEAAQIHIETYRGVLEIMASLNGTKAEPKSELAQVLQALTAPKTVKLLKQDGQTVGAEVRPG